MVLTFNDERNARVNVSKAAGAAAPVGPSAE